MKFYSDTARIAHKMLHMTYSQLNAETRKQIQHRAEALMEIAANVKGTSDDAKECAELIRASLRQILADKPTDETGDVDTFDMANAALNIYSIILT